MKNISVTDKVWKELRQVRDEMELRHYSKTIEQLIVEHKSLGGKRTKKDEKQKHETSLEETSNVCGYDDNW